MRNGFMAMVLAACLLGTPCALRAQDPPESGCRELKAQKSRLCGDLRRIQREIAALCTDLNEPGMENIFSGIGYILGLFGTAAFVASRRRKK